MANYDYQPKLVSKVIQELTQKRKKTVLCGTPGSGKTHMALEVAEALLQGNLRGPILVLTHGQLILRSQWADVAAEKKFDGFGVIESGKDAEAVFKSSRLILSLPQTLRKAKLKKVGALIVDEAHQRYFSDEMQELIERLKPDYQLLLTGTPSPFLRDPDFSVVGITIEELLKYKVLCDPIVEIVQSDYNYGYDDYDPKTGDLRKKKPGADDTHSTLDYMLPQIIRKLISRHRTDPEGFNWVTDTPVSWPIAARKLQKTMIICNNQTQARAVHKYFNSKNINAVISVSDIGDGSKEAEAFVTDPNVLIFIVVQRGILGFNYTELMNVIDMSGTININRIFQSLCRVVRISKDNPTQRKLFIKTTTKMTAKITYYVMSFTMALSTKEYYYGYSTHMKLVKAPVDPDFIKTEANPKPHYPGQAMPDLPPVWSFSELRERIDSGMVAYTDFKSTLNRIYGSKEQWTLEKVKERAMHVAIAGGTRKDFQLMHGGAYVYLFVNGLLHELDEIFGKKKRWDEFAVIEAMEECDTLGQFRAEYPGAFQWMKRHNRLDMIESRFGKRHGSDLLIKRNNSRRYILNNKINHDIARKIREEYKEGNVTYLALSRRYKLAKSTISDLIQHKIWK